MEGIWSSRVRVESRELGRKSNKERRENKRFGRLIFSMWVGIVSLYDREE